MKEAELDKIFLDPKRLAILCELVKWPQPLDFTSLRQACGLTDGNLNNHLKKLSEARIININKKFIDNKPCTLVTLSAHGRKVFLDYMKQLERVVKGAVKRINQLESAEEKLSVSGKAALQRG